MKTDPLRRMHSAEHLLNGTMVKTFQCERSFSAHINKKKGKCDYKFERNLTDEEKKDLEEKINQVIERQLPVNESLENRLQAEEKFNLTRLPGSVGNEVRVIRIGDYDAVPCIGEHVENTSQIGQFRIISSDYDNGILRVRFKLSEPVP